MTKYYLDDAGVRRIRAGLDKLDKYVKGEVPQRRKRGKLTEGDTAESSNTFQLIRCRVISVEEGTLVGDYEETNQPYCIVEGLEEDTSPIAFEENARVPAPSPIYVAFDEDDSPPEVGDIIWAAYNKDIAVIEDSDDYDYGGNISIDWWMIPTGGEGADIKIVLIDKDIIVNETPPPPTRGIKEDDPPSILDLNQVILTEQEIIDEVEVFFQDPVPDDNNYDDNLLDNLNLWGYERIRLVLKYFREPLSVTQNSGTAQSSDSTHITLATGASSTDGFYVGSWVVITAGPGVDEEFQITTYTGSSRLAAIDGVWVTNPTSGSTYKVVKREPGYDSSKFKMVLATTTIDNVDGDYNRKIVRYDTIPAFYDDGESLTLGDYHLADYPDYPENEPFPPDGNGTYAELPEGFLKKRLRGIVINNVLITRLCKELPPPELPLAS